MNRLKPRLTYANVVATLALCIAVGGSSAFAASQLGKNTVGPNQLKKNAVTTAKVKKEAITAAKVKRGTLTGTQINVSTLGTVPSATNAQHAQTADAIQAPEALHLVDQPGEPPFAPTWTNFGLGVPPVAFYKDREGVVHLQGTANANGTKKLVFTLPPAYRPAGIQQFAAIGNGNPTLILVDGTGEVRSDDKVQANL